MAPAAVRAMASAARQSKSLIGLAGMVVLLWGASVRLKRGKLGSASTRASPFQRMSGWPAFRPGHSALTPRSPIGAGARVVDLTSQLVLLAAHAKQIHGAAGPRRIRRTDPVRRRGCPAPLRVRSRLRQRRLGGVVVPAGLSGPRHHRFIATKGVEGIR